MVLSCWLGERRLQKSPSGCLLCSRYRIRSFPFLVTLSPPLIYAFVSRQLTLSVLIKELCNNGISDTFCRPPILYQTGDLEVFMHRSFSLRFLMWLPFTRSILAVILWMVNHIVDLSPNNPLWFSVWSHCSHYPFTQQILPRYLLNTKEWESWHGSDLPLSGARVKGSGMVQRSDQTLRSAVPGAVYHIPTHYMFYWSLWASYLISWPWFPPLQ